MSSSNAKNWDFFSRNKTPGETAAVTPAVSVSVNSLLTDEAEAMPKINTLKPDNPLCPVINNIKEILRNAGFSVLVREVEKNEHGLQGDKFKISVVGEFSRGKSTFINLLFGRDLVPVGSLPTTAILTKVTHSQREMLVFVDSKGKKKVMPLESRSWEGLTADVNGADPQGVAFVGVNSEWLAETGIEIIDTPGAGDLEQKRALLINDALLCGDGAIITIRAEQALSMSEQEFIEQRLLAAKIPCLMLIVTHLDNVKPKERASVMKFIKDKLSLWKVDIPVFIPQDGIEIPEMDCSNFTGIEAIRAEMNKWITDTEHWNRKRASVCTQLLSIMDIAKFSINEKEKLLLLDKDKRDEVMRQQKTQISKIQLYWEELRLEVMKRCNKCYVWLSDSAKEKTEMLVERLQYEAAHAGSPQKWWEEDYPYRLKVERMNLAVSLESGLTQIYTNDLRWLNNVLEKQFKLSVFVEKDVIADKDTYTEMKPISSVEFENIEKQRTWASVGVGAATIAGVMLSVPLGIVVLPVVSSIAVGKGGAVLSDIFFKRKLEEQQHAIKEALAKDIPRMIDNALAISEQRLQDAYNKILKEASAQEELWVKAQLEALTAADKSGVIGKTEELAKIKEHIEKAINEIKDIGGIDNA